MSEEMSLRVHDDPARPDLQVITAEGRLDAAGAARLLRVVDARLQLIRSGQVPTRHLVVDLGEVVRLDPAAATILTRASDACREREVSFALVERGAAAVVGPTARRKLATLPTFATLDEAVRACR